MDITLEKRKNKSFEIFNQIAGTYDLLNRLLSFGIDKSWRKFLILSLPKKNNLEILDLATGTGDLAFQMANDSKVNSVVATDLSQGMIAEGLKKQFRSLKKNPKSGSRKVSFAIEDGCHLSFKDESFDATTVSFGIRNFPSTLQGLEEMYRVLKPGGRTLVLEFSIPKNILFKQIYFLYFRYILPFVGNLVSRHKDAYKYLNQTVEDYPYGESFVSIMKEAGFKNTKFFPLTLGICTLYVGEKI